MHLHFFPVDPDAPGFHLPDPEQGLHDFRPARTHQAGKSRDFTLMDLETDVMQQAFDVHACDLQLYIPDLGVLLREHVGDLAAHHQLHQVFLCDILHIIGSHIRAVPHHGDLVGDLEHLVHLMSDEDKGNALLLQVIDQPEQMLAFLLGNG